MPSRPRLDPLPGQRAGRLWEEYQRATPTQFGQAMSTKGQGFATDAVLNTIPLPNLSGGTFTMWDLKADDFTRYAPVRLVGKQIPSCSLFDDSFHNTVSP